MTTTKPSRATNADLAPLFEEIRIGDLALPNRIVMAPMTRQFAPGGVLDPAADEYYARRARGGVGLIVTEGTVVDHPVSHHSSTAPHFYGEKALTRWRQVCQAVHAEGGRIFPQLWHTGPLRNPEHTENPQDLPIGPSATDNPPVRAMSDRDIADVITAFGNAAADAKHAGFDGIAIHGAHGYLIDQFLWSRTNQRQDRYGGGISDRVRFAVEIVAEIRRRVGPELPILFRFSQWKGGGGFYDVKMAETPQELAALLAPLADAGVDIFDASMRRFWLPEFPGSELNLAGWAKKLTGKTSMAIGSVSLDGQAAPSDKSSAYHSTAVTPANLPRLAEMMARGDFDLVGVGRALLANPDWPRIVRAQAFGTFRPYDPARAITMIEPSIEA
jgi:2,4-dienoyl-CoA reductase-like NADH-dependent reductase (Old Yellow Enzyme family)